MNDKKLVDLYNSHAGKVSDKWLSYLEYYGDELQKFQDKTISILEIGVQNGGSLEVWAKFFPQAKNIVGVDIDERVGQLNFDDGRIEVFVADASTDQTFDFIKNKFPNGFDIILDDGSHKSSDIVRAFLNFFELLHSDGIYIAEDLHCSYWDAWEGGIFNPISSIKFFKYIIDIINYEHWGIQASRIDLLSDFSNNYGVSLKEDLFKKIYSIEFLNSICVIRKCESDENLLKSRVIAGSKAVDFCLAQRPALKSLAPLQNNNEYSNINNNNYYFKNKKLFLLESENKKFESDNKKSKEELRKKNEIIVLLNNEIAAGKTSIQNVRDELNNKQIYLSSLEGRLRGVESSRSWRITKPLRKMGGVARLVRGALVKVRAKGGFINSSRFALAVLKVEGVAGLKKRWVVNYESESSSSVDNYQLWIKNNENIESDDSIYKDLSLLSHRPLISILMPVFNPPIRYLKEAVNSLDEQIYDNWELCLADDASTDPVVREYLEYLSKNHPRVKVLFRAENGHISAASNTALSLASGEFIGLLDNDDILPKNALVSVVQAINDHPHGHLFYSDEDKINEDGVRYDPYFKPDFNYELFLAQNMICHFGVYRRSIVVGLGGFRVGFEGAQDWDLAFRFIEKIDWKTEVIHIPKILYHWRAFSGSTALAVDEKPYVKSSQLLTVREHLSRSNIDAKVDFVSDSIPFLRTQFDADESLNKVSIIVPTKDKVELLRTCIDSVINITKYKNYEIIVVNNNSVESESFAYFEELRSIGVIVIDAPIPFNYSKLNNLAEKHSNGNILCLMNNDIEIIDGDWMREMVSFAVRPDVGCVGAKLLYPNNTVQHAGVILGFGGVAGHGMIGIEDSSYGYFGRAVVHQSYSAVTGACLMVRRDIYRKLNGLEEQLSVAFNDVDFCIRVREAGYRNVWTPFAKMYHHESATRGMEDNSEKIARFNGEVDFMQKRWGDILKVDPAYNPNLTLNHYSGFSLKR